MMIVMMNESKFGCNLRLVGWHCSFGVGLFAELLVRQKLPYASS